MYSLIIYLFFHFEQKRLHNVTLRKQHTPNVTASPFLSNCEQFLSAWLKVYDIKPMGLALLSCVKELPITHTHVRSHTVCSLWSFCWLENEFWLFKCILLFNTPFPLVNRTVKKFWQNIQLWSSHLVSLNIASIPMNVLLTSVIDPLFAILAVLWLESGGACGQLVVST